MLVYCNTLNFYFEDAQEQKGKRSKSISVASNIKLPIGSAATVPSSPVTVHKTIENIPSKDILRLESLCQDLTSRLDLTRTTLSQAESGRNALAVVVKHTVEQVYVCIYC